MKKIEVVIAMFVFSIFAYATGYLYGKKIGQTEICGPLVENLQKALDNQIADGFEKDISYYAQSGCKSLYIRTVAPNNVIKIVRFMGIETDGKIKLICVMIDGQKKNIEYLEFMKSVIKVECADDFKW